ncbi:hypothetical protein BT69DRAFT_1300407 [Atractiella rhizophila]|nr:hypothetical protein BT69DRAFT_1300407 [Atractiella rhizophila]
MLLRRPSLNPRAALSLLSSAFVIRVQLALGVRFGGQRVFLEEWTEHGGEKRGMLERGRQREVNGKREPGKRDKIQGGIETGAGRRFRVSFAPNASHALLSRFVASAAKSPLHAPPLPAGSALSPAVQVFRVGREGRTWDVGETMEDVKNSGMQDGKIASKQQWCRVTKLPA